MPTDLAEGVRDFVIGTTHLLDLKVVAHHHCNPPMSDSIQIGCQHDISEGVIVSLD